nr:peptidase [Mycobacterium botniense]
MICGWLAVSVPGCAHLIDGHGVSMLYDPFHVAGLPVSDGKSGPRENAPAPTGKVKHTDHGDIDTLALLSINDIEEFWAQTYSQYLKGTFTPVEKLVSYDSTDPASPRVCGRRTYHLVNAFFTPRCTLIAWDRGAMLPAGRRYFGDISIPGVLAHEYGHAVQRMAKLVDKKTPGIVYEQQADCFGGVFMRWVAENQSRRFTLSTGEGLDHVLAGLISLRDPVVTPEDRELVDEGHGTALDRVSAFQMGFAGDATTCAGIDMQEIKQRRGDMPMSLQINPTGDLQTGDIAIDEDTLSTLVEVLGKIFSPQRPPRLSFNPAKCPDAETSTPASYCPATNVITVDLPALQKIGTPAQESEEHVLVQGDDTAFSIVMSRYVLAVQHERGLPLDSAMAALRTACLTGVAHRKMAEPLALPSGKSLVLTAGDLDEAVAGLLTNHLVASDVNGVTVPAGFTRITAFRSGVVGTEAQCYLRFP